MQKKKTKSKYKSPVMPRVSPWVLCPILCIVPLAVLCAIMIYGGLNYHVVAQSLLLVGPNGIFGYQGIRICGVSLYSLLMLFGAAAAAVIALMRRERYELDRRDALLIIGVYCVQLFIGARMYHAIETGIQGRTLQVSSFSGQNLFGGLYLSLLVIPLLAKALRKNAWDLFDYAAPSCMTAVFFTKLGCFTEGCCKAKLLTIRDMPIRLPLQLLEAIAVLLVLAFCLWLEERRGLRNEKTLVPPYPAMLTAYCTFRFFLEYLREENITVRGLTLEQFHCLILFIVGLLMICCPRGGKEKKD